MANPYKNRRPQDDGKRGKLRGEHVLIAENLLGKPLPKGALVHHVDGNGKNNNHANLVICPSQTYHQLIHMRQRAFDACGHADWAKCPFCKQWDDPQNMYMYIPKKYKQQRGWHRACQRAYHKEWARNE